MTWGTSRSLWSCKSSGIVCKSGEMSFLKTHNNPGLTMLKIPRVPAQARHISQTYSESLV